MSERIHSQPEYIHTGDSIVTHMLAKVKEMESESGSGIDRLAQLQRMFNRVLTARESDPIYVMFDTGEDIVKIDETGTPAYEDSGLTQYGKASYCGMRAVDDEGKILQLLLNIELCKSDLKEPNFKGIYSIELATATDEELRAGDGARLHEIERPNVHGPAHILDDQVSRKQYESAADMYTWLEEHVHEGEEGAPVGGLLGAAFDWAMQKPEDEVDDYIDYQTAALNMLLANSTEEATLWVQAQDMVVWQRIWPVEKPMRDEISLYQETMYTDDEKPIYAIDMWRNKHQQIEANLYCRDSDGSVLFVRVDSNTTNLNITVDSIDDDDDDD